MTVPAFRRTESVVATCLIFLASFIVTGCPGFGSDGADGDFSDLPDNPEWTDVSPVLDAYCNDCHSVPSQQGAPGGFRYDVCEDTADDSGASTFAARIQTRTVEALPSPMPPITYSPQPTAEDKELLRRWVDNGAPCGGS